MDDFWKCLYEYIIASVEKDIVPLSEMKIEFVGEQDVLDKFADYWGL